jgi:N-acetylneuraminic acid mutarotase
MTPRMTLLVLMSGGVWSWHAAADDAGGPSTARPPALSWATLAPLPDPLGVAGPFAGVAAATNDAADGGVLVVAGGANFPDRPPWDGGTKTWQAAVYVLSTPGAAWVGAAPLPRPLGYGVAASFGGRVWCVGGGDATEHVRSTVALGWDAATQQLRIEADALPPLPEPMALGSGVLVGSRLFVAGGMSTPVATEAVGSFRSIDLAAAPTARRWKEHPTWPGAKRILPVLGQLDGSIYLVSGAALVPDPAAAPGGPAVTRRFLTDAYAFDTRTDAWRRIADCPVPLVAAPGPAIQVAASQLAFLPGDDGSLFFRQKELAGRHPGFPRQVYAYDTAHDAWRTCGVVPAGIRPAVTAPVVAWRGGWIIPSGEVQPGVRSPQILRCEAVGPR